MDRILSDSGFHGHDNVAKSTKEKSEVVALLTALKNGNWAEIKKLLEFSVDAPLYDAENCGHFTALEIASMHGHTINVLNLIALGAGKSGIIQKAILASAKRGHIGCVKILMKMVVCEIVGEDKIRDLLDILPTGDFGRIEEMLKGRDMNDVVSNFGIQLMNLLVVYGCPPSCVQELMDAGVGIEGDGKTGLTPVDCSIYANNFECIRFLLEIGAKFDINQAIFCKDAECLGLIVDILEKKQVVCYSEWIDNVDGKEYMTNLLKYLENINAVDKTGMTLLMWAIEKNESPWGEILVRRGANVNYRSSRGDTALNISCKQGSQEFVEMLLEFNVNINAQIFIYSDEALNAAPIEYKVRKRFDPNAEKGLCCPGESGLLIACANGHYDIVRILIEHEGDVNIMNSLGHTPMMCAAIGGHDNTLTRVLEKGEDVDVNHKNVEGETALMLACILCFDKVVDVLLNYGSDVNAKNNKGKTALMYAALSKKSGKCVQLLLNHNANIHKRNKKGRTALMIACAEDNEEVVDILIRHGADLNGKNNKGRTPIMYAALNGSMTCLQKLIDRGSNLNLKNKKGETALMIACKKGLKEVVELLINNKANLNYKNKQGKTPIMVAACDADTAFLIPKMVDAGAEINTKTDNGTTALIFACGKGLADVAEVLVNCGADINVQNIFGTTAVMYAAKRCHEKCLQKMLDLNADVDIVDYNGHTLFSITIQANYNTFKLLLDSGKFVGEDGLNSVHKDAIIKSEMKVHFPLRNLLLTIERGIFDWNWARVASSMEMIAITAVVSGISPGIIDFYGCSLSPILLAFYKRDVSALHYLFANLYFHPKDIRILTTEIPSIKDCVRYKSTADPLSKAVVEHLCVKPLSLQTWSFLAISQAISNAGPANSRSDRVNALPIPKILRKTLKFNESKVSRSCLHDLFNNKKVPGDSIFKRELSLEMDVEEKGPKYCHHCVSRIEDRYHQRLY